MNKVPLMTDVPRPGTPPTFIALAPRSRLKSALNELLIRPRLPSTLIFALANLKLKINRLPPTEVPIYSPPQTSSQDAGIGTELTEE